MGHGSLLYSVTYAACPLHKTDALSSEENPGKAVKNLEEKIGLTAGFLLGAIPCGGGQDVEPYLQAERSPRSTRPCLIA